MLLSAWVHQKGLWSIREAYEAEICDASWTLETTPGGLAH